MAFREFTITTSTRGLGHMQTEKSWKGGSEDGFWLKVQQRVCERKAVDELLQGWGRETKQGPNRGLGTTVFRGLPGEEK